MFNNLNSESHLSDVINISKAFNLDNNIPIISIIKSILTDKINNFTIDEIFTTIIAFFTGIILLLRYSNYIEKIIPNYKISDETKNTINNYHDIILTIQCFILCTYVIYIINMILIKKDFILTNRYSILFNNIITIGSIIYLLYLNQNKSS